MVDPELLPIFEQYRDPYFTLIRGLGASWQPDVGRHEHRKLLPECDRFRSEFEARHEEGADVSDHRESKRNQQSDLSWTEFSGRVILEPNA
jgi:hypothetical protein